MLHRF